MQRTQWFCCHPQRQHHPKQVSHETLSFCCLVYCWARSWVVEHYACTPCSLAAGQVTVQCCTSFARPCRKTARKPVNGHFVDQKEVSHGTDAVYGAWRTTNCSCNERCEQHEGQRHERNEHRKGSVHRLFSRTYIVTRTSQVTVSRDSLITIS